MWGAVPGEPGREKGRLNSLSSASPMSLRWSAWWRWVQIRNLLLGAHALGFGVGLTSGQAMTSARSRRLRGLAEAEVAVCCVHVGTVTKRKPATGAPPLPSVFLSDLPDASENSRA